MNAFVLRNSLVPNIYTSNDYNVKDGACRDKVTENFNLTLHFRDFQLIVLATYCIVHSHHSSTSFPVAAGKVFSVNNLC